MQPATKKILAVNLLAMIKVFGVLQSTLHFNLWCWHCLGICAGFVYFHCTGRWAVKDNTHGKFILCIPLSAVLQTIPCPLPWPLLPFNSMAVGKGSSIIYIHINIGYMCMPNLYWRYTLKQSTLVCKQWTTTCTSIIYKQLPHNHTL